MDERLTPDMFVACNDGDYDFALEKFRRRCAARSTPCRKDTELWCDLKCLLAALADAASSDCEEEVYDAYLSFKNYCEVDYGIE
jgi:hypothetical protein